MIFLCLEEQLIIFKVTKALQRRRIRYKIGKTKQMNEDECRKGSLHFDTGELEL